MSITINEHSFSNSQIAQLVSAKNYQDVTLTFWDKFKDLFRTNTKQAEVQKLVTQIAEAHTNTSNDILTKLESFNILMGLAKDEERNKFEVVVGEPVFTGGGSIASAVVSFNLCGQSISKLQINDTKTLHTYHNVIAYQAISTISLHIADGACAADNAMSHLFRNFDDLSHVNNGDATLIFRKYLASVCFKDLLAQPAAFEAAVGTMKKLGIHWDGSLLNITGGHIRDLLEYGVRFDGVPINALVEKGVSLKGVTLALLVELGFDMKDAPLWKMLRSGLTSAPTHSVGYKTTLSDLERAGVSFKNTKLVDLIGANFNFKNPQKRVHLNDIIKLGISCADVKFEDIRANGISMSYVELRTLIRKGVDVSEVSLDTLKFSQVGYDNMNHDELIRAGIKADNFVPQLCRRN